MKMARLVFAVALLATTAVTSLEAQAVRTNAGFRAASFPRNDDGSTPLQDLGFTVNFFGNRRSMAYVNNNGNITFDTALATFTPFGLTGTRREIIAPFFGDVDTRGARSALVTYGQDAIDGRRAFGANYVDVGYFGSHDDKLNSFQLVLIERSDTGDGNFDIEFNYNRILWETGDASGGSGGFGGTPAAAGWSNGTGLPDTSYELVGSLITGAFLDGGSRSLARNRLNSSVRGRYVFRARNGSILPPLTILTGGTLPNATLGIPYRFEMTSAGGMAPFRWSLQADPGAPLPGFTLNADGSFSGTPLSAGEYFFTVSHTARGEEGDETVTKRFSITVDPPVLRVTSACPLPRGIVGKQYFSAFEASGSRGPFVWSLSEGSMSIPGLGLNTEGQLSGIPSAPGSYILTVQVAATSAAAVPASRSCGVTIDAPVLDLTTSCALPPATFGVPYSQNLAVSGGRGPYRWAISGALPMGMSLQSDGRVIGTPNVSGSFPFDVTVTDGRGEPSSQSCQLDVNAPVLELATACPLPSATTGVPYSHTLSSTGGDGTYRWSVIGSLPGGLELTPDGLLRGAPYNAGPFLFRLMVSDGDGNAAAYPCSLLVNRAALSLSSCPMPNARVGVAYSRMLSVAGGATPYTFSLAEPLPAGLSLTPSGVLRGTPLRPGFFPLSVRITDARGSVETQSCALFVEAPPLRVATACPLPGAKLGLPYSQQFAVTGGLPPFRYSAIGRLPAGFLLAEDGRLAGSASARGTFPFTVHVSDGQGQSATTDCALGVTLPELPEIRISDVSPSFAPASTGPMLSVELSRAYPLPITGVLNLTVSAETGTFDFDVDRADPRLRFADGQRSARFTIPGGSRSVRFPILSTGTVASVISVSASNLEVLGNALILMPPAKQFRVSRTPPVVSSACYAPRRDGIEVAIAGYTPTRELTKAAVGFSRAPLQTADIDVSPAALEWFVTDEAVRNGGAFTLTLPVQVFGDLAALGEIGVTLANRQGTTSRRVMTRCP